MTRSPWSLVIVLSLPFALSSCLLTAGTYHLATRPHPNIRGIPSIQTAAVHEGQLYLQLTRNSGSSDAKSESVLAKVNLEKLRVKESVPSTEPIRDVRTLPRLPIRIEKAGVIPGDARVVSVQHLSVHRLEDLKDVVPAPSLDVQVVVARVEPSAPRSSRDLEALDWESGGPILIIVYPASETPAGMAVTRNYVERPRWRRAWFLATPVSVAADIITFPLQAILLIAVGC